VTQEECVHRNTNVTMPLAGNNNAIQRHALVRALDVCSFIQPKLPSYCTCQNGDAHSALIACDVNFFGVSDIQLAARLTPCSVPATISFEVIEKLLHIDFKIASLRAGVDEEIPVPGLALIVPGVGDVGIHVLVGLKGDASDLDVKIGVDACGEALHLKKCGRDLIPLLPIYILSHSFNFGDMCK